jgi:hypothetical protein
MGAIEQLAACVEAAGGIFCGLWETPSGDFAMVTEPISLSTIMTPAPGLSIESVRMSLAEVRRRFGIAPEPPDDRRA